MNILSQIGRYPTKKRVLLFDYRHFYFKKMRPLAIHTKIAFYIVALNFYILYEQRVISLLNF